MEEKLAAELMKDLRIFGFAVQLTPNFIRRILTRCNMKLVRADE